MAMHQGPPTADCWFLVGPTASGKTAVGLELARLLAAEVISLDSMAVYRGMDIGTAKPSATQRADIAHHLIDLIDPHEEFSLARYVAAAEQCAAAIHARGSEALFVGGTPLYLKALLRGIFRGPPANWTLRRRLEAEAHRQGPNWLHQRLAAIDPRAASRLHAHDTRRLLRALEVHEATGRTISELQRQFERTREAEQCRVFVLDWPREELYARIDARVEAMFAAGLVGEARTLSARGMPPGRSARQALGYREVLEHLAGQRDLDETIELVKTHTRQFAKRQLTWFRGLCECRWVRVTAADAPAEVAARIALQGRGHA